MIKRVLYRLRRRFGKPLTYCRITSTSINLDTGAQVEAVTTYPIKKAIRLPRKLVREKDASGLFQDTGTYDTHTQRYIIEASMLSIVPDLDTDYILLKGKRFNITQVIELEDQLGYLIVTKAYEGAEQ